MSSHSSTLRTLHPIGAAPRGSYLGRCEELRQNDQTNSHELIICCRVVIARSGGTRARGLGAEALTPLRLCSYTSVETKLTGE